ncbi:MAG: HYR domain-containing protein, partial [Planctomycetota bacterium]
MKQVTKLFSVAVLVFMGSLTTGSELHAQCTPDVDPPVISGMPGDITVTSSDCSDIAVNWAEPTATDGCPGSVSISADIPSGSAFSLGVTPVTYTATDASGNETTATFTVTVTDGTTPTIIANSYSITVPATTGCLGTVTRAQLDLNVSISDNCTLEDDILISVNETAVQNVPSGVYTITWVATDQGGALASVNQVITVTVEDNTDPTISGMPDNIALDANATCVAVANWTEPTAADNCPGVALSSTHVSGATFGLGTTTVTYTATDNAGRTATASFDVTVTDNTPPTFVEGSGWQNVEVDCSYPQPWSDPEVIDNCDPNPSFALLSIVQNSGLGDPPFNPGENWPPGVYQVTYSATDGTGNESEDSIIVTVNGAYGEDCNGNFIDDGCELYAGTASDCDYDGLLDECELSQGQCLDIEPQGPNGIPDCCECFFTFDLEATKNFDEEGHPEQGVITLTWGNPVNLNGGTIYIYRSVPMEDPWACGGSSAFGSGDTGPTPVATLTEGQEVWTDRAVPCDCELKYTVRIECDLAGNGSPSPLGAGSGGGMGSYVEESVTLTGLLPWESDYQFHFYAEANPGSVTLSAGDAPTEIAVDFSIEGTTLETEGCLEAPTQAFTMAVEHDERLEAVNGEIHPDLIAKLGGSAPSFVAFNIENDPVFGGPGWTLGVIYAEVACPFDAVTVDYTNHKTTIGTVYYETTCHEFDETDFEPPLGAIDPTFSALLEFTFKTLTFQPNFPGDATNGEPIANQVVVCGLGHTPDPYSGLHHGSVSVFPPTDAPIFRRGDCWGDGNFDLKDPVLMLNHMFSGIDVLCKDACDINDDGVLDMVDPIYGLMWLMGMGPAPVGYMDPADPYADLPVCDQDHTDDDNLNCETYTA